MQDQTKHVIIKQREATLVSISAYPSVLTHPLSLSLTLRHEDDLAYVTTFFAACFKQGLVFLDGDLGAGKTTLTKHWLRALGHIGAVKSPTYTIVEHYSVTPVNDNDAATEVYHFDLYRLDDPFELELLGIRDYLANPQNLILIEWASKGVPILPAADIVMRLRADHATGERTVIVDVSAAYTAYLQQLQAAFVAVKDLHMQQTQDGSWYVID